MKSVSFSLAFLFFSSTIWSQSVLGTWKTVDDEDGKVTSHVSIYKEDGKVCGKVIKLINPEKRICTKCEGSKKDMPIEGMVILWDLKKESSNLWKDGKIMDPKNGKEYKCKIELEDANTLKVRGFIGFSMFGRTQSWYRVEE